MYVHRNFTIILGFLRFFVIELENRTGQSDRQRDEQDA